MFKSKLRNTLLVASMAAGGLLMGTAPAYATPGTVFTGTDSIVFDVGTEIPGVGPGGFVSVTATELEWRDDAPDVAPNSFLRILPPSSTPVDITSDSGVWVDTGRIQHVNNIIPGGDFNFTIDVLNGFQMLTPGVTFALTGADFLPTVTLGVSFTETSNSLPCPAPNPLGSTCDDIFVIANLDSAKGTFRFTDGTGEEYDMTFRIFAEAAAGSFFDDAIPGGGGTVYTAEDFTSNLFIQARIDQVPEPGSLALLGIGLAGLPLVLARRAKKAEAKKA
jgi:hypothetical protein